MPHLTLGFYLLALQAGTAALAQTFLIWRRYRKIAIKRYGFFLLALFCILLGFIADLYARIMGWAELSAARNAVWILQAAGGLTFIFTAPAFYHSLLGLPFRLWKRILFFAIDALIVLAALADLVAPWLRFPRIFLSLALFGMILYGLVLIPANLNAIGDRTLRRALTVFFILTLCFFPLLYIDAAMSYLPFLSVFHFLEDLAQPLYFLVLNALTIAFGLRYLNQPAYAEKEELTEYFLTKFRITRREREIIRMLLAGEGGKDIGDKLFISPKTVENHVYNIYQKLGVKNRVQLFQLIRANALE